MSGAALHAAAISFCAFIISREIIHALILMVSFAELQDQYTWKIFLLIDHVIIIGVLIWTKKRMENSPITDAPVRYVYANRVPLAGITIHTPEPLTDNVIHTPASPVRPYNYEVAHDYVAGSKDKKSHFT